MTAEVPLDVIVVGGSCGGLACAHALLKTGCCNVTVFERASSISAAGAGLGLGKEALAILRGFGFNKELDDISLPLPTEVNTAVRSSGETRVLQRDEHYNHHRGHSPEHSKILSANLRADWNMMHLSDTAIFPSSKALPAGLLHFSHTVTSTEQPEGSQRVTVKAERRSSKDSDQTEPLQMECDLLVAADGSMSATRKHIRPDESRRWSEISEWRLMGPRLPLRGTSGQMESHRSRLFLRVGLATDVLHVDTVTGKLAFVMTDAPVRQSSYVGLPQCVSSTITVETNRKTEGTLKLWAHELKYSGYCAWRGVVTDSEAPEAAAAVRKAYQDMGSAIYFEIAEGTHGVLYELPRQRLNWLWYVNQDEPPLKGHSVTVKAGEEQIEKMRKSAAQTFRPEMAQLLQATPTPFINAIYDREPLQHLVQGRTVLVGEAAHPTTPHALRSTNMAITDAGCLGKCIERHRDNVQEALRQYEVQRLPQTTQEVLFSRHLGRVKQSLDSSPDWFRLGSEDCESLAQANMSSF